MKRPWLWLALLAYLVLAGSHAAVTPVFEAPDEKAHFGYAWHLLQDGEPPIIAGSAPIAGQPAWRESALGHHPTLYYRVLAAWQRALGMADLTDTSSVVDDDQRGGRFHFRHGWDEVGAGSAEVRTFHRLRWLSILCGAVSLVLVHRLLRLALPTAPRAADLAVGLVALAPGWTLSHAVLDNGALAVTLSLAALLLLAGAAERGRLSLGRGLAVGLVVGLALSTKLTAVGSVALIGLAAAWLLGRAPERRRETLVAAALAGGLAALLWAPWLLRNLELYGEPLGTAAHERAYASSVVPDVLMLRHLTYAVPVLVFRTGVGMIGWNAGYVPAWIQVLAGATLSAALVGLVLGRGRLGLRAGPGLLVAASAVVALGLLLRFNLVFHQPQARYALTGIAGLALLVAAGAAGLARPLGRAARPLAWVLVAGWAAAALHSLATARALLRVDPSGADPAAAILTADLFTPATEPQLTASRIGTATPPSVAWPEPGGRVSLHLWCVDGPKLGGTYEHLGLAFESGRASVPGAVWASLPPGATVLFKLRELVDRRAGEAVAEARESAVLVVERP